MATAMTTRSTSFYGPVPDGNREDLLKEYLGFLKSRNGDADPVTGKLPNREAWLAKAAKDPVANVEPMAQATFERHYAGQGKGETLPAAHTALLAFVKMNAGEAYGVEVVNKARQKLYERPDAFYQAERVLGFEEQYHTRILVGAASHFGVKAEGAWKPPLALKILIGSLVYVPKGFFHPVLLGAELSGVFTFNWTLKRVGELFADQPALRDAMEQRLVEILVDELGHVAFNRMAVGPTGLAAGRWLASKVGEASADFTPELGKLGILQAVRDGFPSFDYAQLPEEVRRRGFFC